MAEAFAGFRFAYRLCRQPPTVQSIISADAALAAGDLVNLESGKADLAVTNDSALVGVVLETKSGMDTVSDRVEVITDWDAVYQVYDANARALGATLDLSGATGAQTVTTSSNVDFIVVAESTASELTLVMIAHGEHWQQP